MLLEADIDLRLAEFLLQVRLRVDAGVLVLFGPSGAGKSLTLQCLAGTVRPDRGRVVVDGQALFDSAAAVALSPQERRIGYVPQNYALFPHLSVAENIAFGLRRSSQSAVEAEVRRLLSLLRLEGLASRRPAQLSGGQQQRVALARALAIRPRLLLLDEPFSALDAEVRDALRADLLRIQQQFNVGVVLVTHDVAETAMLADAVAIYDGGRVLQVGTRDQAFHQPASAVVARLIGATNIVRAQVTGSGTAGTQIAAAGVTLWSRSAAVIGETVLAVIRPEAIRLLDEDEPAPEDELIIPAQIRGSGYRNHHYAVQIALMADGTTELDVTVPVWWWERRAREAGASCRVGIPPGAVHLIRESPSSG